MQVITILGARPQFIKAAPVSQAFRAAGIHETLVHTGQHYDALMSDAFFRDLPLPQPHINLDIGSGSHGRQTGRMLEAIDAFLDKNPVDCVVVYGDTNSTLAGAVAACKLNIPIAHIESGLRSFNRQMPEEHNRVLTDHCSDLLFCPTQTAVENLGREGIERGVQLVGDTMLDAVERFMAIAQQESTILERYKLQPSRFITATIHRPYNTDDPAKLTEIMLGFVGIDEDVIVPLHPRTRKCVERLEPNTLQAIASSRVKLVDPVSYLDMLQLEQNSRVVITDSGGVQKEAFFVRTPCLTIRSETEWTETLKDGWNRLVDTNRDAILRAVQSASCPEREPGNWFGDGDASTIIARSIKSIDSNAPARP